MEGKHKDYPSPDSHNQKSEAKLNVVAAFATAHQGDLKTIITMVRPQTPLIIQPVAPGMHHLLPQLDQQANYTISMVFPIGQP